MFYAAGRYTVFDDEALSCRLYVLPPGELLGELWRGADPDPPLYYLLQCGWVRIFGVGPLGLRSLSIVCFLAALVAMRAAGAAWCGRRTGLAALAICALHPAHLFFGFAGRWYALMFLMVALLLWATAACRGLRACPVHVTGLRSDGSGGVAGVASIVWILSAAGACYTNYFGPVMAGLLWLAGIWRDRADSSTRAGWLMRGVIAAALFAPWMPPFWQRLGDFPAAAGGGATHLGTLVRLGMTLAAGNLAGPRAWWVWGPMAAFAVLMIVLLLRPREQTRVTGPAGATDVLRDVARVWPLAFVVLGSIAAGVASRTLVDKYVMVLSGPACLLAAALIVRACGQDPAVPSAGAAWERRAGWAGAGALALGWLGCGVNLLTQRHWASLRWLDPFPQVVAQVRDAQLHSPTPVVIGPHPSFKYYIALERARVAARRAPLFGRVPPWEVPVVTAAEWRKEYDGAAPRLMPRVWVDSVRDYLPPQGDAQRYWDREVITVGTAGFAHQPDWLEAWGLLEKFYDRVGEPQRFLEDPDADLKDRLDPGVRHPTWRIELQRWRLKQPAPTPAQPPG